MTRPCVDVVVEGPGERPDVLRALRRIEADYTVRRAEDLTVEAMLGRDPSHARLVFTSAEALPRRMAQLADARHHACATLLVCEEATAETAAPPCPAPALITVTGPLSVDSLLQRLSVMVTLRETLIAVHAQLENARLEQATWLARLRMLDEELVLAEQVQRELLPTKIPQVRGARLHTFFAPADRISGDFYDVFRLDETRIGIAVADATGHGVPAALMTALLKRSLRGKEITPQGYRILQPDEVLQRLNGDLIELGASQSQYVAALYAIYDELTREVRWARGGVPYPLLLSGGGEPRCCVSAGILLGVEDRPQLEVASLRLAPGETLLLHTDGLEALLAARRRTTATQATDATVGGRGEEAEGHSAFVLAPGAAPAPMERRFGAWRELRLRTRVTDWDVDDITVVGIEAA
ncbi:MAG: SpoIIE family protein phosphatase [Phycisphaerales bacterium]|nr:SpoIIE family protein phosphatase [Phycisphaerales bacterium]